jgi:hypothetical protein
LRKKSGSLALIEFAQALLFAKRCLRESMGVGRIQAASGAAVHRGLS